MSKWPFAKPVQSEPQGYPDGAFDDSAQAHINACAELAKNQQASVYFMLRDHGRKWQQKTLPSTISFGTLGECFKNAALLAMEHPELTYVEGFATCVIPMHHAWCVDPDGNVVDSTWRTLGTSYFGIPMSTDYVRETALRTGLYSVFFNMRNRELIYTPIEKLHSYDFPITSQSSDFGELL